MDKKVLFLFLADGFEQIHKMILTILGKSGAIHVFTLLKICCVFKL